MKFLILFLLFNFSILIAGEGVFSGCVNYFIKIGTSINQQFKKSSKQVFKAIEQHEFDFKLLPKESIEVGKPSGKVLDKPFGNFTQSSRNEAGVKQWKYSEVPVRAKQGAATVYFGKPFETTEAAMHNIKNFFQNGKYLQPRNTHRDIFRHQLGAKSKQKETFDNINSGFVQASEAYATAMQFATNTPLMDNSVPVRIGVVYVIDSRGAEVLMPGKLTDKYTAETEVLFDTSLPPERVIGAIFIDITSGDAVPQKFIPNPNYKEQK